MNAAETILELWIARTAESYPRHAAALLRHEQDPFRNPVGAALRQSLSHLLRELTGEMDATAIDSALDPIIRLQLVQGFASDDAVRFTTLLEPILRELAGAESSAAFGSRIDDARIGQLERMAVDKYAQCREQLARIRANEVRRTNQVQQRIRARRPA
jgi:RsbT co-antagonist protein rsbRD N-terminal domain